MGCIRNISDPPNFRSADMTIDVTCEKCRDFSNFICHAHIKIIKDPMHCVCDHYTKRNFIDLISENLLKKN